MEYDVVIYGFGHTSTCLQASLAKLTNLRILIISPPYHAPTYASTPRRLFAISEGSLQILSNFVTREQLRKIGQPIEHIKVIEGGSPFCLDFSPEELNTNNFGLMIQEDDLHTLLNKAGSNAPLIHDTIAKLEQDAESVTIYLASGKIITCALFMAADGKHSAVAKKLGVHFLKHDYHQCGLVCEVTHQYPHHGLAVEKFIPSGPFAILPRIDGCSSSIVWSIKSGWRKAFLSLPSSIQHQLIAEHFPENYGHIKVTSDIQMFPLHLQLAKTPIHGRIVLMGDAAHAIHPLSGQGFNLTIRDIDLLSQLIVENYELGLDIGDPILLERYYKKRKFDVNLLIESTHFLNGIFSNNSKFIKLIRGLGIESLDKIDFLKKRCMLYALGGVSDLDLPAIS